MCRFASFSSILLCIAPLICVTCASDADYEVWAADQSSTVTGPARGGLLWIWKNDAIMDQVKDQTNLAKPLPCVPGVDTIGPCNFFDIFPGDLNQMDSNGPTNMRLQDLENVGLWHGITKDPSNKYILASLFLRGGDYVWDY